MLAAVTGAQLTQPQRCAFPSPAYVPSSPAYIPALNDVLATNPACGGAGGAPAPEGGAEPAPAPEGEPAPQ